MRIALKTVLFSGLIALLSFFALRWQRTRGSTPSPLEVRIALPNYEGTAVLWIAQDKGFFRSKACTCSSRRKK